MNPIRVSHPHLYKFESFNGPGEAVMEEGRLTDWKSDISESPGLVSCIGVLEEAIAFNQISVGKHSESSGLFPASFRIEISSDGKIWEPIVREAGFRGEGRNYISWNFPLITAKYVKFLFVNNHSVEGGYQTAFGEFKVMISGIVKVRVSSELDRLWVKENLIDERPEYGWSSAIRPSKEEDFIELDLGSVNRVSEIRMLSRDDENTFFPEGFLISYSDDNISWHNLIEENGFLTEPASWYRWRFLPMNIRYLKITVTEGAKTKEGKFISQIIELELYATADPVERSERTVQHESVPHASVLRSGIVRLGIDGEAVEGVDVQGSDRRLRDATTDSRGIVELASDGEDRPKVVVQGNDRRLKYATEDLPGIIRLARNGEVRAGHVLQSDDDRIKTATAESEGLVELAENGEDRAGVVVQGNDKRLKAATEEAPGIVKLSPPEGTRPNEAVQGSDPRLRDATTESKGILRFARSGEVAAEAAVQGNDPRLKDATTEAKGIVELATDGESRSGVVVQGNDSRLQPATVEKAGVLKLCAPGSNLPEHAVQGNDPRLSDARKPLEHSHDYAPLEHDFSSHTGFIRIEDKTGKAYDGFVAPPLNYAPVTGVNHGEGSGLAGQGDRTGVLGHGRLQGVRGLSEKGVAVSGQSQDGPGGHFESEAFYAAVVGAGSRAPDRASLWVRGLSRMNGPVYLNPVSQEETDPFHAGIAAYFPVRSYDVLMKGDVLVAAEEEGLLKRSNQKMDPKVIGVIVETAALVLNPPDGLLPNEPDRTGVKKPDGHELVAFTGPVRLRATTEAGRIEPGDLLVTSLQGGCAERLKAENPKSGVVFARSLGRLEKGEGLIPALLLG